MIRYKTRVKVLAACLSAVAGYADAIGYLKSGGFFVSFMSGNSTRLAVSSARDEIAQAVSVGCLILLFVLGVIAGSLVGSRFARMRRPAVLAFVTALLCVATGLDYAGLDRGALAAMTLAMGAENAVFERDGEVHIGLTYMTGTLVKLGQRITAAFQGGDRLGWTPYLGLWLGLVCGAVLGALVYPWLGPSALGLAAAAAGLCTIAAART